MEYLDMHLSQVAPVAWQGFLGPLDAAVVEVSGITADGELIPSSSVGNNKTWLDRASQVILEVNRWQSPELLGMHDIYYGAALPPNRVPIPLMRAQVTSVLASPDFPLSTRSKIVGHRSRPTAPDRNAGFHHAWMTRRSAPSPATCWSSSQHEVKRGRVAAERYCRSSPAWAISANAVLTGLIEAPVRRTLRPTPR